MKKLFGLLSDKGIKDKPGKFFIKFASLNN